MSSVLEHLASKQGGEVFGWSTEGRVAAGVGRGGREGGTACHSKDGKEIIVLGFPPSSLSLSSHPPAFLHPYSISAFGFRSPIDRRVGGVRGIGGGSLLMEIASCIASLIVR